ncbi:hypothetical protein VIGAN_01526600, partial [Vigna angularis var. angularis]
LKLKVTITENKNTKIKIKSKYKMKWFLSPEYASTLDSSQTKIRFCRHASGGHSEKRIAMSIKKGTFDYCCP